MQPAYPQAADLIFVIFGTPIMPQGQARKKFINLIGGVGDKYKLCLQDSHLQSLPTDKIDVNMDQKKTFQNRLLVFSLNIYIFCQSLWQRGWEGVFTDF